MPPSEDSYKKETAVLLHSGLPISESENYFFSDCSAL